jgi:hypothetical protein
MASGSTTRRSRRTPIAKTGAPQRSEINSLLRVGIFDLLNKLGHSTRSAANPHHDQIHIFLSYARTDRLVVERLFDKLKAEGLNPWMDVRCIHAGEKWKQAIERAIQKAHFFLLCLTPNSVNRRGFLQREIRMAIDKTQELLDEDIYFLPVRLVECARPLQLAEFQSIDLFAPGGFPLLIAAIKEGCKKTHINIGREPS